LKAIFDLVLFHNMKRLGIGKKGDGDDDSNRSALFGSRSKNKSPSPAANPYAQPAGPPDPYTQAKMNAGVAPLRGGTPDNAPPRYSGPPGQGYGNDNKYGSDNKYGPPQGGYGGGYGGDRYGGGGGRGYGGADRYGGGGGYSGQGNPSGASKYGPGGYGGLGRTLSNDTTTTDDNRDALFGGAQQRYEQRQPQSQGRPPAYGSDSYGQSGAYGDSSSQGYGAYQDRQLTAEEEEEEDVTATKQEIRFMKQQDVSSTRNALRVAAEAEETGRNTLARLGAQGERIHNTERNLDLAANHQRIAAEKAR